RRHQPRAHLADQRLGNVHVIAEVLQIELVEEKVGRLHPRVVAGDAVLVEEGARGSRTATGGGRRLDGGYRLSRRLGGRLRGWLRDGRLRGRFRGRLGCPSRLRRDKTNPGDCEETGEDRGPFHAGNVNANRPPESSSQPFSPPAPQPPPGSPGAVDLDVLAAKQVRGAGLGPLARVFPDLAPAVALRRPVQPALESPDSAEGLLFAG